MVTNGDAREIYAIKSVCRWRAVEQSKTQPTRRLCGKARVRRWTDQVKNGICMWRIVREELYNNVGNGKMTMLAEEEDDNNMKGRDLGWDREWLKQIERKWRRKARKKRHIWCETIVTKNMQQAKIDYFGWENVESINHWKWRSFAALREAGEQ